MRCKRGERINLSCQIYLFFEEVIEMGIIKRELDNVKVFLGDLTEKEFYDRLHLNREKGFNRGQK